MHFKTSDWPGEPYMIACLGSPGLTWPKVFEKFPNLEVIEVEGSTSAVFSLWDGPCPLPRLRRLTFEGTYLGLWSESYELGNVREFALRNCHAMFGRLDQRATIRGAALESLDLSFSDLKGVNFSSVQLQSLNFAYRPESEVPPWTWTQLRLRELNLSGNELRELPAQVTAMAELESLQLADNSFSRLDLGGFRKLKNLNLAGNPLQVSPDLSGLPLETLNLSVCGLERLSTLPNGILNLNASRNRLSEFPEYLPISLQEINLSWNEIHDCNSFAGFASLRVLDLSHNRLANCPELGALRRLNLAFNRIREMPSLISVEELNLAGNMLTGLPLLPPGVRELDVARNRLDSIPLNSCSILNLSLNPLAGLGPHAEEGKQIEVLQAESDRQGDPFSREEYQIINSLTRSGRLQPRTINAYSPMGLAADKRSRFWKAAEFMDIEPDLLRSYALNNSEPYQIDPAQAERPLLKSITAEPDILWHLAGQENIVGFSRVGFSADHLNALVYAQSLDTLTQGSGSLVQLARRGQGWVVVRSEALWMRLL